MLRQVHLIADFQAIFPKQLLMPVNHGETQLVVCSNMIHFGMFFFAELSEILQR